MNIVITVISGLLLLTLLVVVHECGHFWAGRKCGIKINEFAVGFGPKLWKKEKNGTLYSIRALPLGGFCNFYGEDEDISDSGSFNSKPVWKRFLTVLAGPVANILFALILTVAILGIYGESVPVVGEVKQGTPAQQMGLKEGDIIKEMQGNKFDFFIEYAMMETDPKAEYIDFVIERNGETISKTIPTVYDKELKRNLVGITIGQQNQVFGFFEALGLSFKWLWLVIVQMLKALGGLIFAGKGVSEMAGPVGTVTIIGQAVQYGFRSILYIAALLSINLGVVNLLPLPALDGGRLVLLTIEGIRRKAIPREKEAYIHLAGFVLLIGLMVLLTINDISRLVSGG